MSYYIDLEKISIDNYRKKLETGYLPPSRMILKERLDERFGYFKNVGIKNIHELLMVLEKKDTLSDLQKTDCFSMDYLAILLRELKSLLPKPNRIKDFPGISQETIVKLENIGINNTLKLYERVIDHGARKKLAQEAGIDEAIVTELTKLTDLSRIKWVGTTFARILYELGIDTLEKMTQSDPVDLHARLNQFIKEKNLYKGQVGLNDVRILVDVAQDIPLDIEY
jgi:hypothetical protein